MPHGDSTTRRARDRRREPKTVGTEAGRRAGPPGRARRALPHLLLIVFFSPFPAAAQDGPRDAPPDIRRMVRDGMTAALEARLRGSRKPENLHLLAQTHANRAARLRDDVQRQREFGQAQRRYLAWITALANSRGIDATRRDVNVAAARVELAGMILSKWAARGLDELELTAGQRGERERLAQLLQAAREQYDRALALLEPLATQIQEREDEFFALGIHETIQRLRLDITFNLGWTSLYQGVVSRADERQRLELLRLAEGKFEDLLASGKAGTTAPRCLLGLAMAQREQGRYAEAEQNFRRAAQADSGPVLDAQIRYELARCQIAGGKFEEARLTLRPLLEKRDRDLAPEERPVRFYLNLARIWDANSHLIEADALRQAAKNSPARRAILLRARRVSDIGLGKMNALLARGGAWPALVQLYVAPRVKLAADPGTQSPLELLFAARQHLQARRYDQAETRLREALARKSVSAHLRGQFLFELGTCQYKRDDARAAADTFERLAREQQGHPRAPQAATFAYRLRAQLAQDGQRAEDYQRLADTLQLLLEGFPEQARQVQATWWLPVALQAAGRYAQAARQFERVPAASPRWEEAQFRRQLCRRLACEANRAARSTEQYRAQARQVAADLIRYAEQAYARAPSAPDPRQTRNWSAAATVNAAEMLVAADMRQFRRAQALLDGFEQRYADSDLIGRVLAVRIRAQHGLRQFDQAAQTLERYLRAVPAEKTGRVLASLAKGMQEEVERLRARGDAEAARSLAAAAITTFERLERWCRAEPQRAENAAAVSYGLARMYYTAGRLDEATNAVARLLAQDPRNGNLQRLYALILEDRVGEQPAADDLRRAQDAWAALLRDPALRSAAPQRYWEARYHWLGLLLRQGRAADVAEAIAQDRVWSRKLGGPPWREKLEELYRAAVAKADSAPASQPAPRVP